MGCGEALVKLLVFSANLIFALAGLGLITVGVLYKLNLTQYTQAIPEEYQQIGLAPTLTIAVGSAIFLIAFFGCCGAVKESPCLLTTYSVILLVIFLLQVALGVFAFLEIKDKDQLRTRVQSTLEHVYNDYYTPTKNTTEIVDLIQSELKCCGVPGSDWGPNGIPKSCYYGESSLSKYSTDCVTAFYNFLVNSVQVIGIVVLAISALEIFGSIFSLCLSNSIRNRERRFRY